MDSLLDITPRESLTRALDMNENYLGILEKKIRDNKREHETKVKIKIAEFELRGSPNKGHTLTDFIMMRLCSGKMKYMNYNSYWECDKCGYIANRLIK